MVRHVTLVFVLGVAACGVGGGGDDANQNLGGSGSTKDPVAVCSATLAVTGTFTVAAGVTLDSTAGCQPAGTWLVTATVADKGTCSTVPLKSSYSYTLTGTGRDTSLTYTTGAGEDFNGAVEATGNGTCEGSFDHIVMDSGKYDEINLHPELAPATDGAATLAISGSGTYDLWAAHP